MPVFLPLLKQHGRLDSVHMTVCNVGSRKLSQDDDYASQGWHLFAPNLTIYGFDADADACLAANSDLIDRGINWSEEHIPLALSDRTGTSTLYVTKHPMCSSLYPPNEALLSRFKDLINLVGLDYSLEVETTTLDEVCQQEGIESIDFLQVDVQGADLNVLKGAQQILSSTLAVQIEVEFAPLYAGQPLFADVDTHLRTQGFSLFDLAPTRAVRAKSPIYSHVHPGQLLWGEAYYLCDLLQESTPIRAKTPDQLFKLACVADIMNFTDYALELLEYLTIHFGSDPNYNFADVIAEILVQVSQKAEASS